MAELSVPSEEDRGRQKAKSHDDFYQRTNVAGYTQILWQDVHFCFICVAVSQKCTFFIFKLKSLLIFAFRKSITLEVC